MRLFVNVQIHHFSLQIKKCFFIFKSSWVIFIVIQIVVFLSYFTCWHSMWIYFACYLCRLYMVFNQNEQSVADHTSDQFNCEHVRHLSYDGQLHVRPFAEGSTCEDIPAKSPVSGNWRKHLVWSYRELLVYISLFFSFSDVKMKSGVSPATT